MKVSRETIYHNIQFSQKVLGVVSDVPCHNVACVESCHLIVNGGVDWVMILFSWPDNSSGAVTSIEYTREWSGERCIVTLELHVNF